MTAYTWTETVDDIRQAKAGDRCIYQVKDGSEKYESEVVSNGASADTLKVKALPYSASKTDVTVLDKYVLYIIRDLSYDVPDTPGLYFDKNDAVYYQSNINEWWFLYEPKNWHRNMPQVTKIKFEDLDPAYCPFRKATLS